MRSRKYAGGSSGIRPLYVPPFSIVADDANYTFPITTVMSTITGDVVFSFGVMLSSVSVVTDASSGP